MPYQVLKNHLRELRKRAGHTQASAGALLGCHAQFVSNWERGLSYPPTSMLEKLVTIYKLTRRDQRALHDSMLRYLDAESHEANKKRVAILYGRIQ